MPETPPAGEEPAPAVDALTPAGSLPQPSEPVSKEETPPSEPKEETPSSDPKELAPPTPQPPEPSSPAVITISIPSYARWFSFGHIHETERRFLPEFFADPGSPSKNPRVYKYYRDTIVRKFREDPSRKITYTAVRSVLVGDVGSIRRVFDFLEAWGLINYVGAAVKASSKGNEKEFKSGVNGLLPPPVDSPVEKKVCAGCKTVCSVAFYACDKANLILCPRCFFRGNYQFGLNSGDFKRVEINEETKMHWTEKETLRLLEGILQFGDDWKKVAEHVGGRSEKECIARFIKIPSFAEQFVGPPDFDEDKFYEEDHLDGESGEKTPPTKRLCLTPLADASNPIMAQVAFLSAIVGSEVAKNAAQGAVAALSEMNFDFQDGKHGENGSFSKEIDEPDAVTANDQSNCMVLEAAVSEAHALVEREEQQLEQSITETIDVQMREIQDRILHFENMELQMEKEWAQVQNMRNQLFADQLTLLRHKAPLKFAERSEEKMKMLNSIP